MNVEQLVEAELTEGIGSSRKNNRLSSTLSTTNLTLFDLVSLPSCSSWKPAAKSSVRGVHTDAEARGQHL